MEGSRARPQRSESMAQHSGVGVQRYGKGWDPRWDSVHLTRLDPLADGADHGADAAGGDHLGPESNGEMDLGESLDLEEQSDLVELFSRRVSSDVDSIDPAFLSGSEDDGDDGGGRWGGPPSAPTDARGGRQGPHRKKPQKAVWQRRSGVFSIREGHYTVLSPFEPPSTAQNIASASYEGARIARYFYKTQRDVSQVRRRQPRPPPRCRNTPSLGNLTAHPGCSHFVAIAYKPGSNSGKTSRAGTLLAYMHAAHACIGP